MEVYTNTPKVLDSRKKDITALLSNHNRSCLSCVRSGHCELQELAHELGVDDEGYYDGEITPSEIDTSAAHMIRDNSKCILCRRCVAVCENVQGIGVIGANNRGFSTSIGSAFEMGLGETSCVSCGQCMPRMSNRSTDRKGLHRRCVCSHCRPEEACNRSDRSRCTRRTGRGIQASYRHGCGRQDGRSPAPSGL